MNSVNNLLCDLGEQIKIKADSFISVTVDVAYTFQKGIKSICVINGGLGVMLNSEDYLYVDDINLNCLYEKLISRNIFKGKSANKAYNDIKISTLFPVDDVKMKSCIETKELMNNILSNIKEKEFCVEKLSLVFRNQIQCFYTDNIFSVDKRKYYFLNEMQKRDSQIVSNNYMSREKGNLLVTYMQRDIRNFKTKESKEICDINGKFDLILPAGCAALFFHECIGHCLEIQNACHEKAVFYDKIGEIVACEQLTVIDDPTISGLWGSLYADDVGIATHPTILIENGILKNYLVDKYSGSMLGIPVTAATRRESYRYKPTARMSNTYIKNGCINPDEIFSSLGEGIIIWEMKKGHVDPISGDFYVNVDSGEMIKNGRSIGVLKNFELQANAQEVLHSIEMIGNDIKFVEGFCNATSGKIPVSAGQPTIKLKQITCKK